jgi:hypothetical protein
VSSKPGAGHTANRLSDLTWHQILDAMNPKLKAIPQTTAAGKAKHERYVAIQSYLYGVKDAWRNPTMHPRKMGYSDLETLDIAICTDFLGDFNKPLGLLGVVGLRGFARHGLVGPIFS